jgi:hypothetical protein
VEEGAWKFSKEVDDGARRGPPSDGRSRRQGEHQANVSERDLSQTSVRKADGFNAGRIAASIGWMHETFARAMKRRDETPATIAFVRDELIERSLE